MKLYGVICAVQMVLGVLLCFVKVNGGRRAQLFCRALGVCAVLGGAACLVLLVFLSRLQV